MIYIVIFWPGKCIIEEPIRHATELDLGNATSLIYIVSRWEVAASIPSLTPTYEKADSYAAVLTTLRTAA